MRALDSPPADDQHRQHAAIAAFTGCAGYAIIDEYRDAAVFAGNQVEADGVRMVPVEDASRFARLLMEQRLGVPVARGHDVEVACAGGENLTAADDPPRVMTRGGWPAPPPNTRRPARCGSCAAPATAGAPSWAGASRDAGATPRRIRLR